MNDTLRNYLRLIRADSIKFGEPPRPAASTADIEALVAATKRKLGAELPEQYIDFLTISDGLNYDGLYVYDTKSTNMQQTLRDFWHGFVYSNELWRKNSENKSYLIFANDDMDLYVQVSSSGAFQSMDKMAYDLFDQYESFDAMMIAALEKRTYI